MNFRILTIAFDESKELFIEEELNKFTTNKKILNYKAEFFKKKEKAYWSIFIEYKNVHPEGNGVSTKHIEATLSEPDKLLFQKLKDWRKEKAEKQGFAVYIVANNKELLSIINDKPKTLEALKNIDGFGVKKIGSYGKEIIEIINYVE